MENEEKLVLSSLNKTWIFDLDGTICIHNGYKMFDEDVILEEAKNFINNIDKDDMIILLTARKKEFKNQTEDFLKKHNIRYNYIIYDAPCGERIIINDKKPSGLKTAHAINIDRDKFFDMEIKIDENL